MAIDLNVSANIMAASTKSIGKKAYGHMLLSLPGDKETVDEAIEYLRSIKDVIVEEVTENV